MAGLPPKRSPATRRSKHASATAFHRYGGYAPTKAWNNSSPPMWLTEFDSAAPSFETDGDRRDTFCYTVEWRDTMFAAGNLIGALQSGVTAAIFHADVDRHISTR